MILNQLDLIHSYANLVGVCIMVE